MSKIYNVRNFQQKRGCLRRYQSYQRACTTRLRKNVKSCVAMNVSMNNCYYSPRVERENRETKPEVRSSKVDKRNGALCTQREHALARRQKECVINSVKRGRRGRSVTKRLKSREECRVFISLHPWWCHCIASHSLCSLCERYQITRGIEFSTTWEQTISNRFTSFKMSEETISIIV